MEENIGIVYEKLGDYENALLRYQKTLEVKTKTYGLEHVSVASTHLNIGDVYLYQGDNEKAHFQYQNALEIYKKSLGPQHPKTIQASKKLRHMTLLLDFPKSPSDSDNANSLLRVR